MTIIFVKVMTSQQFHGKITFRKSNYGLSNIYLHKRIMSTLLNTFLKFSIVSVALISDQECNSNKTDFKNTVWLILNGK